MIPPNTTVSLSGESLLVKGPHGEITRTLRSEISVSIADGKVLCTIADDSLFAKALWGTYAAHIGNMVRGVNEPFKKTLLIEGVGYRWEISGDTITLALGFSHPVKIKVPKGITVLIDKIGMHVSGVDKEAVGHFAALVRDLKKPEPYKGKGIRYSDETIRRKEGKKSA